MSVRLRQASDEDLVAIWPAARSAHVFASVDELRAWRDENPWRVQVDERGDAALLVPWRAHLDLLALKALWSPPRRIGGMLDGVRAVARARGFTRLVSPILAEEAAGPYLRNDMVVKERLLVLRAAPADIVRVAPPAGITLRDARAQDVDAIAEVESACFDDFWRHDAEDIRSDVDSGRLVVACEGGAVLGYTLCGTRQGDLGLGRLAVIPAARRRGIGRALLADVADYAGQQGAPHVTLCTQQRNAPSRALYAACGFRELPGRLVIAIDRWDAGSKERAE